MKPIYSWIDEETFYSALVFSRPSMGRVVRTILGSLQGGELVLGAMMQALKTGLDSAHSLGTTLGRKYTESDPLTYQMVHDYAAHTAQDGMAAAVSAAENTRKYLYMSYHCSDSLPSMPSLPSGLASTLMTVWRWTPFFNMAAPRASLPSEAKDCKEWQKNKDKWWEDWRTSAGMPPRTRAKDGAAGAASANDEDDEDDEDDEGVDESSRREKRQKTGPTGIAGSTFGQNGLFHYPGELFNRTPDAVQSPIPAFNQTVSVSPFYKPDQAGAAGASTNTTGASTDTLPMHGRPNVDAQNLTFEQIGNYASNSKSVSVAIGAILGLGGGAAWLVRNRGRIGATYQSLLRAQQSGAVPTNLPFDAGDPNNQGNTDNMLAAMA